MIHRRPILRGLRITVFLLGLTLAPLSFIALFARPSSAEFLFSNLTCVIGGVGDQDCDPPTMPEPSSPGAFVASNDFSFSWAASNDASELTYEVCITSNLALLSGSCHEGLTDTSLYAGDIVSDENQQLSWKVRATDANGFSSDYSSPRQVTVDKDDPIVALEASTLLVGGTSPLTTLKGSAADTYLAHYSLTINDPAGDPVDNVTGTADGKTEASLTRDWSVADPTKLTSGLYSATLVAIDQAGRSGQAQVTIEVDNDGPVTTISGGDTIIKSGSITPDVAAEDPRGVTTYAWTADPANPAELTYDSTVSEPTFTPGVEGTYKFTLTTTDGLGNTASSDFSFGYAAELPGLPLPTEPQQEDNTPIDQASNTLPTAVSPASTVTRDPREEGNDDSTDTAQVLGNTTGPSSGLPTTQVAALTPTNDGWRLLGILWYWWLAAIIGVIAAWLAVTRWLAGRRGVSAR